MNKTDKALKEVWTKIVESRDDTLPCEDELKKSLKFTNGFSKKIRHMPHHYFYVYGKALSKIAVFIVVIAIAASTITVYAIFKGLKLKENLRNTDLSIENEQQQKSHITELYSPAYIPSGYYEKETDIEASYMIIRYTGSKGDIYFRQVVDQSEGSYDNEGTLEERVTINNVEGVYLLKQGETMLVWEEYGYIFYLDSSTKLEKEELIKMAESINKE